MQAKAAIVHGGITGMGPGKSALKQMLPQSASDFIFAVIVEEYGVIGAAFLISLYLIMMIRIVMIASKMPAFRVFTRSQSRSDDFYTTCCKYCSCSEFNPCYRATAAVDKLWRYINAGNIFAVRNYLKYQLQDPDL